MKGETSKKQDSFYAIGLNYQKADAEIRGLFSLDDEAKAALLKEAKAQGHHHLVVISTCNRTELYGFAQHPFQLIKLLCAHTRGSLDQFEKVAFVYKSTEAVNHLFKVGAGLDSQILGDFEIIGQLKQAFIFSKEREMAGPYLERLINSVIQASKRVKTETGISSGATSVSFASVHYILNHVENVSQKKLTLFGTGKIGRNTIENLVKHTNNEHITLINRTRSKAEKIAGKFNLIVKDYTDLLSEIQTTDILIVATGAQQPTITADMISSNNDLLILDLSIPKNVENQVNTLPQVKMVHMDELSAMTNETLAQRQTYIPQAKAIIDEVKADFYTWLETRKFVPTIKALKEKLNTIKTVEIAAQQRKSPDLDLEQAEVIGDRIVKKIMNRFAQHLLQEETDDSVQLLHNIFQLEELN